MDNAVANAEMSPQELAPTAQPQLQWPKWGEYFETSGKSGEPIDMPEAAAQLERYKSWRVLADREQQRAIWQEMLAAYTDQVFSIGTVNNSRQPVVVSKKLQQRAAGSAVHLGADGLFRSLSSRHLLVRAVARTGGAGSIEGKTDSRHAGLHHQANALHDPDADPDQHCRLHRSLNCRRATTSRATSPSCWRRARRSIRAKIEFLRQQYGFDLPAHERYFKWAFGMLQGDFGYSFEYQLPVTAVIGDRLWFTMFITFLTIIFTWVIAFPIGIYSATRQYSWGDYGLTFLGLLGLATPNFLLALVLMYLARNMFGTSIGGLYDPQYIDQPMSWAKFVSILRAHLDTGHRDRHRGNGRHDPPRARQPARRVAQALCDDGAGQGHAGIPGA